MPDVELSKPSRRSRAAAPAERAAGASRGPSLRTPSAAAAVAAHAEEAARLLRAIGHSQRLQVLCMLADGELSVGQINERIELSQSALSQQLARMRADGLVTTRREAQTIYYRVASGPAHKLIAALHGIYCAAPGARGRRATRA